MKDQGTALEVQMEIMLQLESWTKDNHNKQATNLFWKINNGSAGTG